MMKRLLFSVVTVAALISALEADALACHCTLPFPKLTLEQQVRKARSQSRVVFSGEVLEITRRPQSFYVEVKFRVKQLWKGDIPEEVTVVTGMGGGDCGYSFEIGKDYLLYAYTSDGNKLGTNICQRTTQLTDAATDLKVLGKGKPSRAGKK
jgi:hypothetical protein